MKIVIGILAIYLGLATAVMGDRAFFAFDNGLTDVKTATGKALLLKELGYDGICTRPDNASADLLETFDEHGVPIFASYVVIEAGKAIPGKVVEHIQSLKGRETLIWLTLTNTQASDEEAVATIRGIYNLSKANGLEVVLYPHVNLCTDTIEKCERLRKLAGCPGLGMSFTLCHYLFTHGDENVESAIKSIAPHLKIVQISGANRQPLEDPDMLQLIQPLGEGDFDIGRVIRTLDEIGYLGPVNLQSYRIQQPASEHLKTSMKTWKRYNERP